MSRSVMPQAMLRAFWLRRRVRSAATKALGLTPSIELYFAFDDPYTAVALPAVIDLARRHGVALSLYPVGNHGIVGDPDLPLRREASIVDAARLLRRHGRVLRHRPPIEPDAVRFLAAWTESARVSGTEAAFAAAAVASIWESADPLSVTGPLRSVYERVVNAPPPADRGPFDQAVARNEKRLRARGHWETPAARIAGEWFFAHERVEQMNELLTDLLSRREATR